MKQKAWSKANETYRQVSTTSIMDQLAPGIYIPGVDMSGFFLTQYSEKFVFPYKIYGVNDQFITRIERTFQSTHENVGVLLNGLKGTGKSVTSELICNRFMEELNMPVILINTRMEGLIEFLANINQDVVIFVDEYEKVFVTADGNRALGSQQSTEILTLMDGALKSEYRRLFLFTTNNKHIDDNLLERPGRIRYIKEFSDLTRPVIEEIVDDLLIYTEYRDNCIEFISKLSKITIDIVKAVITEVNIHNENPENFRDVFNVSVKKMSWVIYKGVVADAEKHLHTPAFKDVTRFSRDFFLQKSFSRNDISHRRDQNLDIYARIDEEWCSLGDFYDYEDNVLTVTVNSGYDDDDNPINPVLVKYTLFKTQSYHSSYSERMFAL